MEVFLINKRKEHVWDDGAGALEKNDNDIAVLMAINSEEPKQFIDVSNITKQFDYDDNGYDHDLSEQDLSGFTFPTSGAYHDEAQEYNTPRRAGEGIAGSDYWKRYFSGDTFDSPMDMPAPLEKEEPPIEPLRQPTIFANRIKEHLSNQRLENQPNSNYVSLDVRDEGQKVSLQNQEMLVAPKKSSNRHKTGLIGTLVLLFVFAVAVALIAQPWVPASVDDYTVPEASAISEPVTLRVGDSWTIPLALGENEEIVSITTPDSDILGVMDNHVIALGEWKESKIVITTKEKEIILSSGKTVKIFGIDLSKPYNATRMFLRNLFGIEEKPVERLEKRILGIYEQKFRVSGYEITHSPIPVNLYTGDRCELNLAIPDGMTVEFAFEGDVIAVESTLPGEDGIAIYSAKSNSKTGVGKIVAKVGFYKEGIFVTTQAVEFDVEVLDKPSIDNESVFANGDYNGTIPIDELYPPIPQEEEKPGEDEERPQN